MSLERELYAIFQRFVYSSVFLHFRRNLEKYNQWKPFFISLVFLALLDSVVLFLCAILLPTMFVGSFTISIVIFLSYWYFRIEKYKKIGNTKNSKYWDEAQFWLGLSFCNLNRKLLMYSEGTDLEQKLLLQVVMVE